MVSRLFRRNHGSGKVVTVTKHKHPGTELCVRSRVTLLTDGASGTILREDKLVKLFYVLRDDSQYQWVPAHWCKLAPPWE